MTLPLRSDICLAVATIPDLNRIGRRIIEILLSERAITLATGLASLEVDETIRVPTREKGNFFDAKNRARVLLNDPTAKWTIRSVKGTLEIRRVSFDFDPKKSHNRIGEGARILASLDVGENLLGDPEYFPGPWSLSTSRKWAARRLLGVSTAEWTSRSTTKGLRVTRIR